MFPNVESRDMKLSIAKKLENLTQENIMLKDVETKSKEKDIEIEYQTKTIEQLQQQRDNVIDQNIKLKQELKLLKDQYIADRGRELRIDADTNND
jgi:hypothetical protein